MEIHLYKCGIGLVPVSVRHASVEYSSIPSRHRANEVPNCRTTRVEEFSVDI